jgi:hypothetical protein
VKTPALRALANSGTQSGASRSAGRIV